MRSSRTLLIVSATTIIVIVSLLFLVFSPSILGVVDTMLYPPKVVQLEDGEFQIISPYAFNKSLEEINTPFGTTAELTVYTAIRGDTAYFVAFTDYKAGSVDVPVFMKGGEGNFLHNINGAIDDRREIDFSGHPAIEVVAHGTSRDSSPIVGMARIIGTDTRLYIIITMTLNRSKPTEAMRDFINSFEINTK